MPINNYANILITGGAGFIGSNFLRYLYHNYPEYNIYNLDLLTYAGNQENLKDITALDNKQDQPAGRYHFIKGDICDENIVDHLVSEHKIDVIINFAAESHVDRSIVNSKNFIHTNIMGVHNLLEIGRKYKIKRFVQISTDEVYGDVLNGHSTEESALRPSNNYSVSKTSADFLVQSYIRVYQFPAIILRGSNNYGPYQYPEKLIPLAITNLIENNPVPIHGNGLQVRSWLHVIDFCRAIDLVLHQAENYSIYNVSGEEKRNIEVIDTIAKILKKDLSTHINYINDRPGGDQRYAPVCTKIKRELKWEPQYNFNDSLESIIAWYDQNQFWWKKIKLKEEFIDHYKKQCQAQYF